MDDMTIDLDNLTLCRDGTVVADLPVGFRYGITDARLLMAEHDRLGRRLSIQDVQLIMSQRSAAVPVRLQHEGDWSCR